MSEQPQKQEIRQRSHSVGRLARLFTAAALGVSAVYAVDSALGPDTYYPSRPLTDNEIAFSRSLFGDSIEYEKVRIVRVPENSIHARLMDADGFVGPSIVPQISMVGDHNYCDDYTSSECGVTLAALFAHEMGHIWQRAGNAPLVKYILGTRTYDYDLSEEPDFNRLGLEQQAEVIYDYVSDYAYHSFNNQTCKIIDSFADPLLASTMHGQFEAAERTYGDFIAGFQPDIASGPRGLTETETIVLGGIFGDQIDLPGLVLVPDDSGMNSSSFIVTKCDIDGACDTPGAKYEISIGTRSWQDDYALTTNESHLEKFIHAALIVAEGRSSCAYGGCGYEDYDSMADIMNTDKSFAGYSNYVQGNLLTIYANAYFVKSSRENCTFRNTMSRDDVEYQDYLARVTEMVETHFPAARAARIAYAGHPSVPTGGSVPQAAQPA